MSNRDDALRRDLVELLPNLRRFAYALTGARSDADDLSQATIVRLLERKVPEDADLRRWAFRVCKNLWIDDRRARSVRLQAAAAGDVSGDAATDGERTAIGRIALGEAEDAMAALPADQRAALTLVAVEGLSYAEAAQTLDVPVGTIMSRVSRARVALSELLPAGLARKAAV